MATPTRRIYVLFPTLRGLSAQTIDYSGREYIIAASSIRQAYWAAHNNVWVNPDDDYPTGLIGAYDKHSRPDWRMWCGCANPTNLHHGDGVTKIRKELRSHRSRCTKRLLDELI